MVQVDKELFLKRAERFYEFWESGKYGLDDVDAIYIINGSEDIYSRTSSFQQFLFNNQLYDTLAVFTKKGMYFLASSKKAEYFNPVASDDFQGSVPPIYPIHRNKSDKDAENFKKLLDQIQESGGKIGCLQKEKFDGEFYKGWAGVIGGCDLEKVDISIALGHFLAPKDGDEIKYCKIAGEAAGNWWQAARKKLVDMIADSKRPRHNKVAKELEDIHASNAVQSTLSGNKDRLETAFTPIVMSGGQYSFKWSHESDEKTQLHHGVIISTIGIRYDGYCANVTRTILVDPSESQTNNYEKILAAQQELISFLKPNAKLSDVYNRTLQSLKAKDPQLAEKLWTKDFGFATGSTFRENMFTISAKCDEIIVPGMVFVVYLGVNDLKNSTAKDEAGKRYAIAISDTVLVGPEETTIITEKAKSRLKSIMVRLADDDDGDRDDNKENGTDLGRGKRSVLINDQTRNKETNEDKRKDHQKELMKQLNESAKQRLASQQGSEDVVKVKKSNVSYKSIDRFPQEEDINKLNIYVDRKHDTVIVPVFGVPIPFHISTVKNCSQSIEGDFTYLRINFSHPGSNIGKEAANFPFPLATYVKELTYRASNLKENHDSVAPSMNLTNAFRLIKEIQKRFRTEEAEEREKEGAVKQDKLILSQGKANPKLKDLFVRPNIIAKRISGALEAHVNGFRYTSMRGDRIDVLYNNVKHAFFQPCDNEMIILLHFHLKNPVLWGKKKYGDIQFFTEVGEITTDLGKYHHMQDRDDIQSEQMEREMRRKLNAMFKNFCEKVEKQTNEQFDFDMPFSELGFFGVPFRSSTTLKPTSTCLINLTEWPPFIVTLEEVELVHFERVSFSVKNFDMVFIFKDYSRKTQMIQQIPMTSLDSIKEWLNSCDIKYNEGLQSLNWPKIMKTITDNPQAFFEDGGWGFLDNNSDDEEAENDDSEDSEAYDPEEEDDEDEEDSDEDESEGEATDEEDESDASADEDSEESGKSWSDLEEEARAADKRKELEDKYNDHGDRDRDRKRPAGHHSSHHSSHHSKGGPPAKKRK